VARKLIKFISQHAAVKHTNDIVHFIQKQSSQSDSY